MRYLLIVLFLILRNISYSQQDTDNLGLKQPRSKQDFDKPGHYEIAAISDRITVNKGGTISVDIFITGYGQISSSKLLIYSPNKIIDTNLSIIFHSLGKEGRYLYWGNTSMKLRTEATEITFSGIEFKQNSSSYTDMYVDANQAKESLGIITEILGKKAPINIEIFLNKDINPGNYKIQYYYTYFNGREWASSSATMELKVNNWTEANADIITIISIILAIFGAIPVLGILIKYYVKFVKNNIIKFFSTRGPK